MIHISVLYQVNYYLLKFPDSYMTVFKIWRLFCGQMSVKIIGSTEETIQSYVCFNLVHVHRLSF